MKLNREVFAWQPHVHCLEFYDGRDGEYKCHKINMRGVKSFWCSKEHLWKMTHASSLAKRAGRKSNKWMKQVFVETCWGLLMAAGVGQGEPSRRKEEIAFLCTIISDQPDKSLLVRSVFSVGTEKIMNLELLGEEGKRFLLGWEARAFRWGMQVCTVCVHSFWGYSGPCSYLAFLKSKSLASLLPEIKGGKTCLQFSTQLLRNK